ncbi:MAG: glycosyltransferase family 4 protein [Bdellovibrionales bacterium]|jgi:glycosyltransferase involved in cell wall biosynthesis|nr:glycosyltransferase family 4 protein [Bdellovibrionales bacterium]
MIKTWDSASLTFRRFVEQNHAPVILQVLPALNSGGVEQGVIDINAAIVRAGGKSIVVSSGGLRMHEIAKAGGVHVEMPVHSKNPLVMAATATRLRKLIRDMNVDIVHACSRAPAWVAGRAVQGTDARYVTSCHATHKVGGMFKRAYNASITKGARVIAVSHFIADYLEQNYKVDPNIVRVIHRGVALEKFHPNSVTPDRLIKISQQMRIPEGAAVVMLPARISRIKGHMFLLDAIEALGKKDLFCLFLGTDIGNENYRKELEAYIDSKGLSGSCRIITTCDDMPAAYMISTVVVCPTLQPEGFGRVPVEAQAMGRPVIATDHGGTRETILRDETGWLVTPGDVDALTRSLHEAISLDPRGRAVLATRGMAHVAAHFTNEQMCEGTLDVYAELLGAGVVKALPYDDSFIVSEADRAAG